jgi:hypothetical protein
MTAHAIVVVAYTLFVKAGSNAAAIRIAKALVARERKISRFQGLRSYFSLPTHQVQYLRG